jgi:predicted DCC family thiol-disulfide oxidoreductase YuxK
LSDPKNKTVIFFDGSCPLCRFEIGMYSDCDTSGALRLVDVSGANAALPQVLDKEKAMARFHVIAQDGRMLSGAAAFIEVWRPLRGWRWAATVASLPGLTATLECAYSVFLKLRSALVQLFRKRDCDGWRLDNPALVRLPPCIQFAQDTCRASCGNLLRQHSSPALSRTSADAIAANLRCVLSTMEGV